MRPPCRLSGFLRRTACFWISIVQVAIGLEAVALADPLPLTAAAEIRNLGSDGASPGLPVRLRGVVTYSEQTDFHAIFLQDESAGIYVKDVADETIQQGQVVEIEGVTASGDFAPIVQAHTWRILGTAPLPKARAVTAAEMRGGQLDSQWLEVHGIVRAVTPHTPGRYYLEIAMERDPLRVMLSGFPEDRIPALVDSRVRVRGVCFTKRNSSKQWLANYLGVSGIEQVTIEESAPDSAALPVQTIARLFRFPPVGTDGHRVKVQGIVLYAQPGGMAFVKDETQALQVQTRDNFPVAPGDRVEVLGFPVGGGFYPLMEEARLRVVEHGVLPLPIPAAIADVMAGRFGGELVQLEARLVDSVHRPGESVFILQDAGQLFVARLSGARPIANVPPVGSKLRLSGVCLLPALADWEHTAPIRPASFEMLLRDMADVVVLEAPSWWTVRRIATALAIVTGILVAAMIWVVMLRHRVVTQTKLIENKIQQEATLEERTRIARELHDTLAQGFVGIAFQLEAVATHLSETAHEARGHLDIALTMVRHSLAEARRSVMNLRAQALEKSDLAGALVETTKSLLGSSQVRFELHTKGRARRLSPLVENNILRIGQEAITNAVKYSMGDSIQIHLLYSNEITELRVKDFGTGFDTSKVKQTEGSHFGLRGMRERAREMNAELVINSQPGLGTVITVTVPYTPYESARVETEDYAGPVAAPFS